MALKRGFNTVEEHDHQIISRWNQVVTKRDTVWVMGDVTMEKANYEILGKLNGIINVVGGNHDRPQHTRKMLDYINGFCGATRLKGFILTHIPVHPSELERFRGNIHGHVHDQTINDPRYINVSLENTDFYPVLIDDITKRHEDTRMKFSVIETIFIPEYFSECYVEVWDPLHQIRQHQPLKYEDKEVMVNGVQHNGNIAMLLITLITNNPKETLMLERGEHLCAYI